MTGRGTMETVIRATESGAFDYIAKPFELDSLLEGLGARILGLHAGIMAGWFWLVKYIVTV